MPNFAIIENGKVINTVVAEANYATTQGWIELTDDAGIDWDYVNGQFVNNNPAPAVVNTTPTKEELLVQLQALQTQIQALA